ncbi:MAG: M23 family metallopeptidase [Candidatus Methylomirabilales bacterium]
MPRRAIIGLTLGFFLLAGSLTWAKELEVHMPQPTLAQGDLSPVTVTPPESLGRLEARFRGLSLPAHPGEGTYTVLLAVDLETPPGSYPVEFEARGVSGRRYQLQSSVTVVDGRFPVQRLTLPKGMVDLDAKTLERVRREAKVVKGIWKKWKGGPFWWQDFVLPLAGQLDVSSEFGLRRILNGQPRRPHGGVDFRAPRGTPVRASNGGLVVYTGEMFFNGKSVVVHHGGGLFTTYLHLHEYQVRSGQEVAKGEVLGWVGATGRATGPHLHWGGNLRGVRFDPRRLLDLSLP